MSGSAGAGVSIALEDPSSPWVRRASFPSEAASIVSREAGMDNRLVPQTCGPTLHEPSDCANDQSQMAPPIGPSPNFPPIENEPVPVNARQGCCGERAPRGHRGGVHGIVVTAKPKQMQPQR